MTALDSSRFRFGFLVLVLFTMLAGDVWRYTVTWYGFGALILAMAVVCALLLVRARRSGRLSLGALPQPLIVFLLLAALSIAWSFYPGASAIGAFSTWLTVGGAVALAVSFSWPEVLRALGIALRLILGLSIVFELFVSLVLRRPLLPLWYEYPEGKLAPALYWSRDVLLDGGKIQGIVGNSTLLGFVALLGLIVFAVQLADGKTTPLRGALWLVLAAVTVYLTRSATITVALVAVAAVAAAVLAIRRAPAGRGRAMLYWAMAAVVVAVVVGGVLLRDRLLDALGKSGDLTGRGDIWASVIDLAQQRPLFGWGWVSYWAPWVEPFQGLAFEGGVNQYQAHNAWLDLWLQLGAVGVLVFGALVFFTATRAWFLATDRPMRLPRTAGRYDASSMLPILVLTALIMQSLAESRLLVEYGLVLLVIVAVKTKAGDRELVGAP